MIDILLEPFTYEYMRNAILICGLVSCICSFLSCFLILKGWSLMGDALAHSIVPGVSIAYLLNLPYAIGAFFSGLLAALSMTIIKQASNIKEDAVIGLVFTSFFALGLVIVSINPTSVNIQTIVLGNILSISQEDMAQVTFIALIVFVILLFKWRDLLSVFFDEKHAQTIGLNTTALKILYFCLLSAAAVTALQTVGACLVIAMLVTPGATAYLLTDRFERFIMLSILFGSLCGALGAYLSYYMNVSPGGLIVSIQSFLFVVILFISPRYGLIATNFNRTGA